jgi:hypothetical protein
MKMIRVEGRDVRVADADVPLFLEWIRQGYRPLHFKCDNCGYLGTAKLEQKDFTFAKTGECRLTCPKCAQETSLDLRKNSWEITASALEGAW